MNEHILARVPGALAYFVFSAEGQRLSSVTTDAGRLDESTLDLLGHVCVANKAIANMEMRGWEGVSGIAGFYPVESFVFVGVNLSVVAGSSHAFVLDNEGADYETAQRVLSELEN
ncbi:MAG: hypothetical protein B7Y40_04455 [Gammaproteobacteria bacterium 28-57-27]|nr:MAG: hypothetical protein B7Y40_04455 [Gammaproteobacteria bacterium 28-57-27]